MLCSFADFLIMLLPFTLFVCVYFLESWEITVCMSLLAFPLIIVFHLLLCQIEQISLYICHKVQKVLHINCDIVILDIYYIWFLSYFAKGNEDNCIMLVTSCLLNKFKLFSVRVFSSSFLYLRNQCFSPFLWLFLCCCHLLYLLASFVVQWEITMW